MKRPQLRIRLKAWRAIAVVPLMVTVGAVSGGMPALGQISHPPTTIKAARSPGAEVFVKWCSDCHSTPTGPGSQALQRKYQGQVSDVLEQRTDLQPEFVKYVVRHGQSFMPFFRKTEISDADLALLAAYLARSSATASMSGGKSGSAKRKEK